MPAPQGETSLHIKRAGRAYQGAFEALFAILIGAGLGYWADAKFESSPWGLFAGLILGFAAFVLRLVRLGREFQAAAEAERQQIGNGENT